MTKVKQADLAIRVCGVTSRVALLLAVLLAPRANAANTWDGGGDDDKWGSATNWDDNVVPTFPAALTFGGLTRLTPTNDLDGGRSPTSPLPPARGRSSLSATLLRWVGMLPSRSGGV